MPYPIDQTRLLAALAKRLDVGSDEGVTIDAAECRQIRSLIRRGLAAETDDAPAPEHWQEEIAVDRAFDSQVATLSNPGDAEEPDEWPWPDGESLTAYLRTKFPDRAVSAANLRPLVNGMSKQTLAFDMAEGDSVTPLIMRRDIKRPFVGTSVRQEYDLLKPLFDAGFIVPEPLWIEEEVPGIPSCFLISRRVEGVIAGNASTGELSGSGPLLAGLLADTFARLHRLPVNDLGLPSSIYRTDGTSPVAENVRFWKELYEREVTQLSPLVIAGFEWSIANLPALETPAVVQGDPGFHNLMVAGDRVTGLIDWELGHIGDPAEDICGARLYLGQTMAFDQFLALYEAAGGPRISEERLRYYEIFRLARDASILARGMEQFHDGRSSRLDRMNNLHVVYSMCLSRLGEIMERV